jgi:gliding motility-associated-like protein
LLPDLNNNGLPGVTNMPRNTLRIRFKVMAECGFVSNAQPLYGTRAINACRRKTNNLTKAGKPLVINGLNPTYGVQLNVQPVAAGDPLCGSNKTYEVQIRLLGSPAATDSVYVALPDGASYQSGSYSPIQNAPAGPPTLLPNGFRLALPAGAASNTLMVFRYGVSYGPGTACTDPSMNVQTRVRSEAFCKSLGKPCAVYVATGEQFLNINVLRPELDLSIVGIEEKIPGSGITVSVSNTGAVQASSLKVEIWNDVNGDGIAAAPDVLLTTLSGNALSPGQKINLSGVVNLLPEQLCNLLFVLPAAENCLCDPKTLPLGSISLPKQSIWACAIEPLPIGVPAQNGFTYQWLTPQGIASPGSATTTFTPSSQMKPGEKVTLILQAKSGDCVVLRSFEVTLSDKPSLTGNQNVVCKGTPLVLNVDPPGVSYSWAGQGTSGQSGKSITVTSGTNGTYTVTVTFANNCTATASLQVNVLLSDTTTLPVLKTCAGSPIKVLNQVTDKAGIYTLKGKKSNGCDSLVFQQLIVDQGVSKSIQQTLCVGDTLRIFDTLLTKNGQVCRTFKAANGCDSLHCIQGNFVDLKPGLPLITDTITAEAGKPITLKGPLGYASYTWIPPDTTCLCPSLVVTPDTAAFQTFTLRVRDANGCSGELAYRVLLLPPCETRKVLIPNAFTPNGDGVNDLFRAVPCEGCGTLAKMTIYDRWGNLVYEGTQNPAWDGRKDGELAPPDVYVWIIEVQCGEGNIKKTGGVALLR